MTTTFIATNKTHREVTKAKCKICGKITALTQPYGEGTDFFPRKHRFNGNICRGVSIDAELIDVLVRIPK